MAAGCGAKNTNTEGQPATNVATDAGQGDNAVPAAKTWDKMPEMTIDPNKSYEAVVETTDGQFTIKLFAKDAPQTVNNFVFLSKQNYYNGVKFHRIIQSFMIQSGDPTGTGAGGPGYTIPDELHNGHKYMKGVVAMANTSQPDSGGSQFFIGSGADVEGLNGLPNYTIFGEVSRGLDVVDKIAATPVESSGRELSKPKETIQILSIEIKES